MRETKKSTAEAEEAKAGAAATATAQRQKERSEKKKEQQQREKNKTTTTSEIKKIKKKKNKNKKRNESSSSSFVQRHVVVPITDVFRAIKSMNYRQLTLQLLSLTLIVTSALMIWKSLCLYTHSESPVVVVLSGSMEPAFKRGDILFLSLKKKEKKTKKRISFSDNSNSIVGGGGVATTTTTTTTKKKKKKNEEEEERGEEERTRVGEIIVFSIDGREIPIVHRVIKSHYHPYSNASLTSSSSSSSPQSSFDKADDDSSGSIGSGSGSSYDDNGRDDENSSLSSPSPSFKHEMLTKGDNNYMDDIGLYAPGQKWLNEKHVMGRTVGYLPHVGKATILMNDHPMIKYALILVLGLLVISGKEG